MRRLTEYIVDWKQKQITEAMLFESEMYMITEGTFLKKFANWLGSLGGKMTAKIKEYQKDLVDFGKNVQTAFNGYVANSINDDSLPKETAQQNLEIITSAKPEEIPSKIAEIYNNNKNDANFKNSPTTAYLYLYGLEIAKEKGDAENQKILQDAFDSIPADVKKKAAENLKAERAENVPDKPEEAKPEENKPAEGQETVDPKKEPEKVEEIVDKVAEDDKITELAKEAQIKDIGKLKDFVTQKLKDSGKEFNEETVQGLLVMICNACKDQDFKKVEPVAASLDISISDILDIAQ